MNIRPADLMKLPGVTLGPPVRLPGVMPAAELHRMRPRSKPEESFLRAVLDYARLHCWRTYHARPGRTADGYRTPVQGDGIGFPDVVFVRLGRMVVAELKAGKNRLSGEQRAWLDAFRAAGVPAYEWRPTDWPEIERVLGDTKGVADG